VTAPRSPDELLEQVRATAEGFTVYGELGRNSDRDIWYLARDLEGGHLVALRLRQQGADESYSLEIAKELDKEVPLGGGDCPGCGAPLRSFARFCGKCGADLTAASRMPQTPEERAELLEQVRIASSEAYDVVGEMTWGAGSGLVYFAIEKGTGRLVRLRLKLEGDEYSLGETQAAPALKTKVMAAYTSGVTPAVPKGPEPPPPLAPPPLEPPRPRAVRRPASGLKVGLIVGGVLLVILIAYFAFAG